MDFNIGNLVCAVVGAVVTVANAVVDFFSPIADEGGIVGDIAGVAVEAAEAVLGAVPAAADVNGDGEIDAEEAEVIFNNVVKAMLGGLIVAFGSGSSGSSVEDKVDNVSESKSNNVKIHEETQKPTRIHVGESGDGFWGKVADAWVSSPIYDGLASMAEWQYDNPKATDAINFASIFIVPGSPAGISGVEKETQVIENRSMKLVSVESKIEKITKEVTQAETEQVKKGLPDWLKERFNKGNQFNKDNRPRYDYNEVRVTKDGNEFRVDSYNRNSEIVSRKFTQLGEIKEETAISYLNELDKKYSPGTEIINGTFNPKELGGLTLEGQMILEVPVQKYDIPAKVLEKAKELYIVIRDVEGKVYK